MSINMDAVQSAMTRKGAYLLERIQDGDVGSPDWKTRTAFVEFLALSKAAIAEVRLLDRLLKAEQEDCQLQRANKNAEWERAEAAEREVGVLKRQHNIMVCAFRALQTAIDNPIEEMDISHLASVKCRNALKEVDETV